MQKLLLSLILLSSNCHSMDMVQPLKKQDKELTGFQDGDIDLDTEFVEVEIVSTDKDINAIVTDVEVQAENQIVPHIPPAPKNSVDCKKICKSCKGPTIACVLGSGLGLMTYYGITFLASRAK